ncbi:MAG: DUF72 domain-containing protein [Treponema sp.]|nr:DUF72 domain-containing protein [Treponema sp.]
MAEILIGTSGYSYNDWIGPVYPEGTRREDFLSLYAARFDTVEINYTYYSMPKAANIARMLDEAPALSFAIKANDLLTHRIDPAAWQDHAKTYITAIEPLLQSGRLEAVLFQFPYSFHYTEDRRRYLGKILEAFKGIPSALEFRNAEWFNDRVIEGLRERSVTLTGLDMPDLANLPPKLDVVTAPLAYFRLHGRNKEQWWGPESTATTRYDYLYSDSELQTTAARLTQIILQADRVIIYFNNHSRGKAVKNAETLKQLLAQGLGPEVVQGQNP